MAAALPYLIAAGSAVATYKQGQEQSDAARQNQILQQEQADASQAQGVYEQNRYKRMLNQVIGKQRAAIGANNTQDLGSPLRLQEDAAATGQQDLSNIRTQAALQSWGYQVGADTAGQRAKNYATQGTIGAASSILGGSRQGYSSWKR